MCEITGLIPCLVLWCECVPAVPRASPRLDVPDPREQLEPGHCLLRSAVKPLAAWVATGVHWINIMQREDMDQDSRRRWSTMAALWVSTLVLVALKAGGKQSLIRTCFVLLVV